MSKQAIAKKLKELRELSGLTQSAVGAMFGKAYQTVASWESGKSQPDADTLIKLCDLYGVQDIIGTFAPTIESTSDLSLRNLSKLEQALINKYRSLDAHGRGTVDTILDREHARCNPGPAAVRTRETAEGEPDRLLVYYDAASAGFGNYLSDTGGEMLEFPAGTVPAKADCGIKIAGDSMEPKIPDGSIVFVHCCPAIDNNEIGIFRFRGEGYCKKLIIDYRRRQTRLKSFNPDYDDIIVDAPSEFCTFGRVLGWRAGE